MLTLKPSEFLESELGKDSDNWTVRPERTGWRDQELSARHRMWGWNCPWLDLDFVALEFNNGKPAFLVEYKNERAAPVNCDHPTYRAFAELGNGYREGIPVFICRYASDFSWLKVRPLNDKAKKFLSHATVMNEADWVSLMYKIRGREAPPMLLAMFQNGS